MLDGSGYDDNMDADHDNTETPTLGYVDGQMMDMECAEMGDDSNFSSSMQRREDSKIEEPDFFLYTKLNQNDTKALKKAGTNVEERRQLATIFKLKTITDTDPNKQPSKVDLLKLDFHFMNYAFCKKHGFSNEKVSTTLAIFDHVFSQMLSKQLKPEVGLKMLKDLLKRHSIQRPPFQIFIFSEQEVEHIIQFSLTTFLRHFSLYEFAFKPRIELVLRMDPVFNSKFNAPLMGLDAMSEVEQEEAEKMRMFLGQLESKHSAIAEVDMALHGSMSGRNGDIMHTGASKYSKTNQSVMQEESLAGDMNGSVHGVDYRQVGRVYDANEKVEDVIQSEMERIHRAFD